MSNRYEVIVGNIGAVYAGRNKRIADRSFAANVRKSKDGYGRWAGEPVTLMNGDDLIREYHPKEKRNE